MAWIRSLVRPSSLFTLALSVVTASSALDAPLSEVRDNRLAQPEPRSRIKAERHRTSLADLVSLTGAKAPLVTPSVIIAATVTTCLLYVDPARFIASDELVLYIVMGLFICLCLLLLAVTRATAHDGNAREYDELRKRVSELEARLKVLKNMAHAEHQNPTAMEQACADTAGLQAALASPGAEWPSGNGYIGAWKLLHHAEEALIEVRSFEAAVAVGIQDALRLSGSSIAQCDQLTSRLNQAIMVLSPDSFHRYVLSDPMAGLIFRTGNGANASPVVADEANSDCPKSKEVDECCPQCVAKSVLRYVRYAVDEYRDNFRAGLLRTRNILLATLTFTALGTYALASAAVVHDVGRTVVGAAAAYFALGAVVGLFNRLRIASRLSNSDNPFDVEDYGLAWARAMAAPIFSGLAAVIGVFVISQLQISVSGVGLVPVAQAVQAAVEAPRPPDIAQIFNLHANSFGLLLAAVFGTTPELLTSYLQKPAADLKKGLQSSASAGGKTPA